MTKKILLDLQYLPPIQYFSKWVKYEEVWIEQHENYLKGSYRNRCRIAGVNGIIRLSIPLLKGKNEQQHIQSVKIAYHEPWQSQHWNSIASAYGNAPYFAFYADEIAAFYKKHYEYLFEFNKELLECILRMIGLPEELHLTEMYQKTLEADILDFRNGIFPKKHRQKEDKAFEPVHYSQVFEDKNGFLPNLSILDLLFCTGPQAILILENSVVEPLS